MVETISCFSGDGHVFGRFNRTDVKLSAESILDPQFCMPVPHAMCSLCRNMVSEPALSSGDRAVAIDISRPDNADGPTHRILHIQLAKHDRPKAKMRLRDSAAAVAPMHESIFAPTPSIQHWGQRDDDFSDAMRVAVRRLTDRDNAPKPPTKQSSSPLAQQEERAIRTIRPNPKQSSVATTASWQSAISHGLQ